MVTFILQTNRPFCGLTPGSDTSIKWVQFSNSGNADLMGACVMNVRDSFDYDWKVTDSIGFREILIHL